MHNPDRMDNLSVSSVQRTVSSEATMPLLKIDQLTMRFGGLTAVQQLDLEVQPGQIFSIIGPNGAGKTTVFNAITGIFPPPVAASGSTVSHWIQPGRREPGS